MKRLFLFGTFVCTTVAQSATIEDGLLVNGTLDFADSLAESRDISLEVSPGDVLFKGRWNWGNLGFSTTVTESDFSTIPDYPMIFTTQAVPSGTYPFAHYGNYGSLILKGRKNNGNGGIDFLIGDGNDYFSAMVIERNTGDVVIGLTNPHETLHVSGGFRTDLGGQYSAKITGGPLVISKDKSWGNIGMQSQITEDDFNSIPDHPIIFTTHAKLSGSYPFAHTGNYGSLILKG